jgi:pimeloyl-ACP methyl ester carboxylesterase
MHIEVNGAPIFFDTVGPKLSLGEAAMPERPTLVVMHGGPGFDHSLMRPYFDRFADTHQVVYLDHRGNGRSGGPPETWNLAQWGDDVHAFCGALGIDKPVVYGLSFGGMVAMSYAARHPDGPGKLILASTAATMDLDATYAMMERLGGPEARRIAREFWTAPGPGSVADYMRVCMPLYNPGGAPLDEGKGRAIMRTEVLFQFIQGEQRTMDLRAGLADIACPTLVLAGGMDPITPLPCSQAIAGALRPGIGELVVLQEAGHGVHRDEPERAEAVLRRFLSGGILT